jgi:putative FmdB family regulatory protein
MPVFEYKCSKCETKFEVFHKSSSNPEEVVCPKCSSKENKKLFSSFAASVSSGSSGDSCASGSCGVPSFGGCANGMCGLN